MVDPATPPPAEAPVVPPPVVPPATPPVEPPKVEPPVVPPVKPEVKPETLLGAAKIVPEKYELKMPEGSPLDKTEAITRVEAYAKANKLSNEEAQQLLEVENTAVKTFADKQQAQMHTLRTTWAEESKNDKEFGGDNFAQNVELSRRVVDKFGSAAFRAALNDTGLGNHPELIRMLSRIGKAVGEDELVVGKTATGKEAPKDPAKTLYPNQK
jgi:hypothetical protein